MADSKISRVEAMEVLDSRGNPTVQASVFVTAGQRGVAMVPSGASTGVHEAMELRDGDEKRYVGKGVTKAVANIEEKISLAVAGIDVCDQRAVDMRMNEVDGTENKSNLGANAILAVSLAAARAGAAVQLQPLYRYLRNHFGSSSDELVLPVPFMNVINGGKHAVGGVDFQEFMIVPHGFSKYSEALAAAAQVFHTLKKILVKEGFTVLVGDEGGFAPAFEKNKQALDYLVRAIGEAGYKAGEQVAIGMDPAVSELWDKEAGVYKLASEKREMKASELVEYWEELVGEYPIVSIEDGLDQDAWDDWGMMTEKLGERVQLVGDDFLVTNTKRLKQAINKKSCNAILVKVNQIGTLTEAVEAITMAKKNDFGVMVSHRSGETEDTFIADLAVGLATGQIKTGSLSRSDRVAKYNRLLVIEKELGEKAEYMKYEYKGK